VREDDRRTVTAAVLEADPLAVDVGKWHGRDFLLAGRGAARLYRHAGLVCTKSSRQRARSVRDLHGGGSIISGMDEWSVESVEVAL
jgi:hypothetical protein